jgi:hypothetical protein
MKKERLLGVSPFLLNPTDLTRGARIDAAAKGNSRKAKKPNLQKVCVEYQKRQFTFQMSRR